MMRWSHLHGDMQGRRGAHKDAPSTHESREQDIKRNSLSGKFRPARMA